MVILGTALLAACYLAGTLVGDALGRLIGVQANVGGVGIAMMLLIATQHALRRRGLLKLDTEKGVTFWAAMYIPVVVAMAATQNVVVAIRSGPLALLAAAGSFALCASAVAFINRRILARAERSEEISAGSPAIDAQ